eukprot:159491_1
MTAIVENKAIYYPYQTVIDNSVLLVDKFEDSQYYKGQKLLFADYTGRKKYDTKKCSRIFIRDFKQRQDLTTDTSKSIEDQLFDIRSRNNVWWPLSFDVQTTFQVQQFEIYYAGRLFTEQRDIYTYQAALLDNIILNQLFENNQPIVRQLSGDWKDKKGNRIDIRRYSNSTAFIKNNFLFDIGIVDIPYKRYEEKFNNSQIYKHVGLQAFHSHSRKMSLQCRNLYIRITSRRGRGNLPADNLKEAAIVVMKFASAYPISAKRIIWVRKK